MLALAAAAAAAATGALEFSREHIVDVHHTDMHAGPVNVLFRSNMPINASGAFDLPALTDGIRRRAQALNLPLSWPPYIVDVSLNNEFDLKDGFGKEQAFWREASAAQFGNFTNWPLGTAGIAPPSDFSEAKRRELLASTVWKVDELPRRVDLLRDMLVSTRVAGRSVVLVVHCTAGCDRTGEVIGAYRLNYGGLGLDGTAAAPHNVTSMYAANTAECGRSPNYWSTTALEWFCYDLLYSGGVSSGNCTGFASCKFGGDCVPTAGALQDEEPASAKPVPLIIDTDAGFDVDDAGAVCLANALQDNGETKIIAVGHTNGYVKGIGAVSALMEFYNRGSVPLGSYKGVWARNPRAPGARGTADRYVPDLADNYPAPIRDSSQTPTAVDVYRAALSKAEDHSVAIAAIGIPTNMRDLLASKPDQFSSLGGTALVAQKVKLIVWMDGLYNFGCAQHDEDNWLGSDAGCRGSAKLAVEGWPSSVKQIFSGVGGDVMHGDWLEGCAAKGNPCRQAFEDWGVAGRGRSSWDPISVMIAVRGVVGVHCKESGQGGHQTFPPGSRDGVEHWVSGSSSNQSFVQYSGKGAQAAISFELNQLLCQPPGGFIASNGVWNAAKGENCYGPRGKSPAHGATDIDTTTPVGVMSLSECQQKCLETPGCTAVTVSEEKGGFACYRKADINLRLCDAGTKFSTYVATEWQLARGFNCFGARGSAPAHGARDLENPPGSSCGTMDVRSCQQKCSQLKDCNAVTWQGAKHSGVGKCYRKFVDNLKGCDRGTSFDTYLARTPFSGAANSTTLKTDEAVHVRRRGVQWALGVASGKNTSGSDVPDFLLGSNPHRWANTSLRVSDITTGILQCCSGLVVNISGHLLIEYPEGEIAPHVFDAYTARGLEVFVDVDPAEGEFEAGTPRPAIGLNCSNPPTADQHDCTTPADICAAALARKEAFAAEVLAFTLEWGVSGISVDWEYSYGNNQTCFVELFSFVHGVIAPHGKGFAPWVSNGGGW